MRGLAASCSACLTSWILDPGEACPSAVVVRGAVAAKQGSAARPVVQVRLHDVAALRITPLDPRPAHVVWRPWQGQPMFERHEEDEAWIPEPLRAQQGHADCQQ